MSASNSPNYPSTPASTPNTRCVPAPIKIPNLTRTANFYNSEIPIFSVEGVELSPRELSPPTIKIPAWKPVSEHISTPYPRFSPKDFHVSAYENLVYTPVSSPPSIQLPPPSIHLPSIHLPSPSTQPPIVAPYVEYNDDPFSPVDIHQPHPYMYDFDNNVVLEVAPVPHAIEEVYMPSFNYSPSPVVEYSDAPCSHL